MKEDEIKDTMCSIKKEAQDYSISTTGSINAKELNKYYGKTISVYGMQDIDEFISECIAEYMNGLKKCRPIAKKVVYVLLR